MIDFCTIIDGNVASESSRYNSRMAGSQDSNLRTTPLSDQVYGVWPAEPPRLGNSTSFFAPFKLSSPEEKIMRTPSVLFRWLWASQELFVQQFLSLLLLLALLCPSKSAAGFHFWCSDEVLNGNVGGGGDRACGVGGGRGRTTPRRAHASSLNWI